MPKLLSICNPAHNNGARLKELVDSVAKEVSDSDMLSTQIDLILCNNSSSDGSQVDAENFAKTHSWAYYFESPHLLSPTESVEWALSKCDTDYVWIVGDDSLCEGSLQCVLQKLDRQKPDIVITNSVIRTDDHSITKRYLTSDLDHMPLMSMKLASLRASWNHFFISNYVIKTSVIREYWPLSKTSWPHLEVLCKYLDSGRERVEIIQSKSIILESQSEWYSPIHRKSPILNAKRNRLFFELLDIASQNYTTPHAKTVQSHAQTCAKLLIIYQRARLTFGDIKNLYVRYGIKLNEIVRLYQRKCMLRILHVFRKSQTLMFPS
jgi:glycosyltransferase involved in cell wall biosynthesis